MRIITLLSLLFISSSHLFAEVTSAPGDYSVRAKIGPGFDLKDYENQFRIGAEFDYELGYSMGLNFLLLGGIGDSYRFQMIPGLRYDYLYIGPASFYGIAGLGYARYEDQNALDVRLGSGVVLPLGNRYQFNSDVSMFFSPVGTPGTPITFDWLMGFGIRFD